MQRLIGCFLTVTSIAATPRGRLQHFKALQIVSESTLLWTHPKGELGGHFESSIVLSDEYYQQLRHSAIPVDMNHLAALRGQGGGGLPIDIYCWLAHRMNYLNAPSRITWAQVAAQFGSQYAQSRQFLVEFVKALGKVLTVYPGFNIQEWEHGLLLKRSKTPIAPKSQPR